jgi:hypothetical protein
MVILCLSTRDAFITIYELSFVELPAGNKLPADNKNKTTKTNFFMIDRPALFAFIKMPLGNIN